MPVVFTLSTSRVVAAGTCFMLYITPAYALYFYVTGQALRPLYSQRMRPLYPQRTHACMQDIALSDIMHRLPFLYHCLHSCAVTRRL